MLPLVTEFSLSLPEFSLSLPEFSLSLPEFSLRCDTPPPPSSDAPEPNHRGALMKLTCRPMAETLTLTNGPFCRSTELKYNQASRKYEAKTKDAVCLQ